MMPDEPQARLDAALLAAYDAGDRAEIGRLYAQAAAKATCLSERCFFLTQAYVFALEAGGPEAAMLRAELVALGADR